MEEPPQYQDNVKQPLEKGVEMAAEPHCKVFKTSNRIVDDLRADGYLLQSNKEGVLGKCSLDYAMSLDLDLKHKVMILNNKLDFLPNEETVTTDTHNFVTLRGLVANPAKISSIDQLDPFFHFKMVIQRKIGSSCYKHQFFSEPNGKGIGRDSAMFVCKNCRTVLTISVWDAEFPAKDLFDEEKIKSRFQSFSTPELNTSSPSPHDCLQTLFKVLKGPLTRAPSEELKTIRANNVSLNAHLDKEFLFEHLQFKQNQDESELIPPIVSSSNLRDSYLRKTLEVVYLGSVTKSEKNKFFSTTFSFSDNAGLIFRHLNEFDREKSIQQPDFKTGKVAYIALACEPHFSDDLIQAVVTILGDLNSSKWPIIVDFVTLLCHTRDSRVLADYLRSKNVVGHQEMCHRYRAFGLEYPCDDSILLERYRTISANLASLAEKNALRNQLVQVSRNNKVVTRFLETEPFFDVLEAYANLEVPDTIENDVLITAYDIKKSDYSDESGTFARSLWTIALARRSVWLLNYISMNLPQMLNHAVDVDSSFQAIEVSHEANDFEVITAFEKKLQEKDPGLLFQSLKCIGKARGSALIGRYLVNGKIDRNFLPVEMTPVGLNNIGNTCYLNSLLQYYFVIEPLRSRMLDFTKVISSESFSEDEVLQKRRIGGRVVGFKETERSYQFVYQLRDLFKELVSSRSRCVTPKRELAYLAFSPSTDAVEFGENNCISLDQMENALELGRQQDVTECIENVLFQLEAAFPALKLDEDSEQYDLVKELFYGKTKQLLIPPEQSMQQVRSKVERFVSLIVNTSNHPKTIYDALDDCFAEDVLEIDNEDVKRRLVVTELPKFLQIQIQRVQFDLQRFVPFKSLDPVAFGETLYMDRYLDTDDPIIIEKRKESSLWKEQIKELDNVRKQICSVSETGLSVKDSLIAAKSFLQSSVFQDYGFSVEPETISVLEKQVEAINSKIHSLDSQLQDLEHKVASQFDDFKKIGYSLFAVFIHRGEASYGHYWIYIKDPKSNVYRKYNDEIISEVLPDEIFNFKEGNTATPYFLVYVKEGLEEQVEPLKRTSPTPQGVLQKAG